MSVSTVPKDPAKVRAGSIGGRQRWHGRDRFTIRLDALSPEQRRLVIALVEAARSEKAATDVETVTAPEVRGGSLDDSAA